jgi:hypothetical protein
MTNTSEKKSTSRPKNALTHGVYARDHVLPGESEDDFAELYRLNCAELNPVGHAEEAIVLDYTDWEWKKRRLNVGSLLPFHRDLDAEALAQAREKGWSGMVEYLAGPLGRGDRVRADVREMTRSYATAMKTLTNRLIALALAFETAPDESKRAEIDALQKIVDQANLWGPHYVKQFMIGIQLVNLDEKPGERPYQPDAIEKAAKTIVIINREMDKCLARLARVKEFKRLYGVKAVEGRRTVANRDAQDDTDQAA